MGIKSQKDFFSGLMFLVVGGAFAIGAYSYGMGDGARMGPGYFPRMLGILMANLVAVDFDSTGLCGDFTNLAGIAQTVRTVSPDIIVNAAAHTAVDKAESEQSKCAQAVQPQHGALAGERRRL